MLFTINRNARFGVFAYIISAQRIMTPTGVISRRDGQNTLASIREMSVAKNGLNCRSRRGGVCAKLYI